MTDNITLRCEVVWQLKRTLEGWANHGQWKWPESALLTCKENTEEALAAIDAALAEPVTLERERAVELTRAYQEGYEHGSRNARQEPEPESKTPAWWMDGLTVTLMREGVNKHRAREIAIGYWEAYCQIPGNEEDET
jgi:hypothetical protein